MNEKLYAHPDAPVIPSQATASVAGHFGELIQGRNGPDGPVVLVTLPCPIMVTRVTYVPGRGPVTASEPVSLKACSAARLALAEIGADGWGGTLAIDRPARPGLGFGSSTAETLGAIRSVTQAFSGRMTIEREASLCLLVEGAIDPLMIPGPVLFASRAGRVVRSLPALPPMRIVGGFAGKSQQTDPADKDFPDVAALIGDLIEAAFAQDLAGLAQAADRSATAHQEKNPNPAWDDVRALGEHHGAIGIVVSHTGPAIGLILPPDRCHGDLIRDLIAAGLEGVMGFTP